MRKQILSWLWLWLLLLPALAFSAIAPIAAPAPKTAAPAPKASATAPTAVATPPPVASASPPKKAPATPAPAAATPPPKAAPISVTTPAAAPAKAPKAAAPVHAPKASPPTKKPTAHAPSPSHTPKAAPSPKSATAPSPASAPASTSAPSPAPATHTLVAAQIAALKSLEVNYSKPDPCASPKSLLLCDNKTPRRLQALSLSNCPKTAKLTTEALVNLSSLQAISFVDCPMVPVHVPSILIKSLTSFICTASLGKTGTNEKAAKLKGVWLSKLTNLNEISVSAVELSASGLSVITGGLQSLTHLAIFSVNIGGLLPKNTWPPSVEYIDVSGNSIRGTVPSKIRELTSLTHLDFSNNQLKGVIPNVFGELNNLQYVNLAGNKLSGPIPGSTPLLHNCSHLDLSNNNLNGSIPANISNMRALRYLDLSQNQLTGQIPFNSTFLKRLTTFKISNNAGLCYNHTAIKSKLLTGIPDCAPPPSNLYAPAPAPALSEVSSSSGGGSHLSKGAIAGISVVVIVVGAAAFVGVRKWWKAREDPDQFMNLRSQRT